jgi:hypothetical protein
MKRQKAFNYFRFTILFCCLSLVAFITIILLNISGTEDTNEKIPPVINVISTGTINEKIPPVINVISTGTIIDNFIPVISHNYTSIASKKNLNMNFPDQIHFIHIPKCGGTSMTAILRQVQCNNDLIKHADCCINPGFCDWHAFRRCESIKGCINHFPQRFFMLFFMQY